MSTILPSAVYELCQNLSDLPETLRLRSLEWGVLFSVTGRHTVAQIGDLLGVPPALRDATFARLLDGGLLKERPLSYGEYVRAAATAGDEEPRSLAEFLRSGATWPAEARDTAVIRTVEAGPPSQEAPLAAAERVLLKDMSDGYDPTVTRAVPTVSRDEVLAFKPLASPAVESGEPEDVAGSPTSAEDSVIDKEKKPDTNGEPKRMSLRALMGYILDRAPDLNSGQLDIYRVFIRVDTKLLKRNGITTLRFKEDCPVDDPELQAAIQTSLQATLGLSCPQQVFI